MCCHSKSMLKSSALFFACLLGAGSVVSGCSCSQEQLNDGSIPLEDSVTAKNEEEPPNRETASVDQAAELSDSAESAESVGAGAATTTAKDNVEQPTNETRPSPIPSGGRNKKRELPAWLNGEQSAESHGGRRQTGEDKSASSGQEARAARTAAQKARAHLAASRKAGKKNPQAAFREALAGWQLVAPHVAKNEQCGALSATLEKELRIYGEAANRTAREPDRFRILAVE